MFIITSLKQIIFFMAHTNFWIEWFIESRIEARQLLEVLMTWLQISEALMRVPFANKIASVLEGLYLISPRSYYWRPIKSTTLSYFNYIQVTWLIWFKSELISRLKLYCRHKKYKNVNLLQVCCLPTPQYFLKMIPAKFQDPRHISQKIPNVKFAFDVWLSI